MLYNCPVVGVRTGLVLAFSSPKESCVAYIIHQKAISRRTWKGQPDVGEIIGDRLVSRRCRNVVMPLTQRWEL